MGPTSRVVFCATMFVALLVAGCSKSNELQVPLPQEAASTTSKFSAVLGPIGGVPSGVQVTFLGDSVAILGKNFSAGMKAFFGMNTDVAGVQYALSAAGADDDGPILLLGCGGAAAAALLAVEGRSIHLSCRDAARSALLLRRIAVDAAVIPWGTPLQSATVINTTPLGMSGETLPDGVVERAGALLDMAYGFERTPAIAHALALGIPAADGLSMLVGQAAAAFELFPGEEAPIYVMEQAARA